MADSTPDFSAKHPLEHTWTLWFDNPNGRQKQATWGQTLRSVYTCLLYTSPSPRDA